MKYRKLGNSNIDIAPLVFGANVFGWTVDERQSFRLLDALVEREINMIDTANVYSVWAEGHSGGESENIIGKWLQQSGQRENVVIATKVGMEMGDGSKGLSKANIIKSAEDSLRRLNTDYIDVYYAHCDDKDTPFEETLGAFEQLIKQGKLKNIASSNYESSRLDSILDFAKQNNLPQFIAHQPEFNLYDRGGFDTALQATCKKNELGVVTYFSLASGFLSGKYRNAEDLNKSNRGSDFIEKYMTERGKAILSALEQVANIKGVPMATVAIAWLANHPAVTAPITSATTIEQLDQLHQAATLTLSENEMATLTEAGE